MKASILRSIKEVQEIKYEWASLYSVSNNQNPFLTWEWIRLWLDLEGDDLKIRVVVIKDKGSIVCIAPFCIKNKELLFLSDSLFSDYMDILVLKNSAEIFELIVDTIIQSNEWDRSDLLTIPESSGMLQHYQPVFSKKTIFSVAQICHINPFIPLVGDFDDFILKRSKGFRQDLRTTSNKLDKDPRGWEFVDANTRSEKDDILTALIKFHLERQQSKVGTSIFDNPQNIDFYRGLIHSNDLPWEINLSGIRVSDKYVSASISIITDDVFYYWIPAFDLSFRGGSLGQLHVKHLIEKCFRDGLQRFDFMGGCEPYKMRWTNDYYNNYRILSYRSKSKLYRDKVWSSLRGKLQQAKERSRLLSRVWIRVSKLVGK